MNYRVVGRGVAVGALLTAPALGLLYFASELSGLPFVPYDVFDWITRILPGGIVTFGLETMINTLLFLNLGVSETAKISERAIAVLQFVAVGAVAGGLISLIVERFDRQSLISTGVRVGALIGIAAAIVSISIEGSTVNSSLVILWLTAVFAIWGFAIGYVQVRLGSGGSITSQPEYVADSQNSIDRREFVIKAGASIAVITVAGTVAGNLLASAARREIEQAIAASVATPTPVPTAVPGATAEPTMAVIEQPIPVIQVMPFPNVNDPISPVDGTRPEYTAVEDHYEVSLRTKPTVIDGSNWSLEISGMVANPVSMSIDDLRRDFEPRSEFVTLSCISGRVGGRLISTTQWTGLRVQELLDLIQPHDNAFYLDITCADGFHELVDLNMIRKDERIMLCYAWNGESLPIDHGFPLRIWLPDRYGMKQPRWIESIEVTDKFREGYWVKRGWDAVARVEPTSVIDTIDADSIFEIDGQSLVPVGGIAFAGAKEISKVEVKVGDGPWQEAELRSPLSQTTWVIWKYDWPFEPGNHLFKVRCVTGAGAAQAEDVRGTHPSGATGSHSKRARL